MCVCIFVISDQLQQLFILDEKKRSVGLSCDTTFYIKANQL